jgi:hypothetical protein
MLPGVNVRDTIADNADDLVVVIPGNEVFVTV